MPFIPAKLDDAGLTAAQFRIVARIARRGDCNESVPKMARGCRLDKGTVWAALSALLDLKFITKTSRPGRSTLYKVASSELWSAPTRNGHPPEKTGRVAKPDDTHPKRQGDHPPEKTGHKGYPFEGNPMKGDGPPKFEPVKLRQYRREYEADIKDAQEQIRKVKADPANYARDMTDATCDLVALLTKEKPDGWGNRITEAKANPAAYERTSLKPTGAAIVQAWKDRIAEIRKAMAGIIN